MRSWQGRAAPWPLLCSTTLLVLLLARPAPACAAARRLQQLQPSDCLGVDRKCEAGYSKAGDYRCCVRCLGNYQPVVVGREHANIIAICVCPKGFYEATPNATTCTRCERNSYCPGGDRSEAPNARGPIIPCGDNLVTRTTGAGSPLDCVALGGYALATAAAATPCGRSEFAPMFNRLPTCFKCSSGLEEWPTSNLTIAQRVNKRVVCKVPPGRYMSQGLVRWCPQGFYRDTYEDYDAKVAQDACIACQPGITTPGMGARSAAECNRVLPGHGIAQVLYNTNNNTGPQSIPSLPQTSSGGLPAALVCPVTFYASNNGYCMQCPNGAVTASPGALSVEACVVPPGYITANGSLVQCGPGSFRAGWVMVTDPRATQCTPCGDGVSSEATDPDENPLAANSSTARASSTSCFIEAGQGMVASGKDTFSAFDCPADTYGAAARAYGLESGPCKPCPRNMITDGLTKVTSSDICINPDGFGYATEGASRCAPGFYALKGSRQPCQRCPYGRTTADNTTLQRLFTDCFVKPGFGLVSSSSSSASDAGYLADTSGLTDAQAAGMPVQPCPVGCYGPGNSIRGTCIKCPDSTSTADVGAVDVTQCSVCLPGYGQQGGSAACTLCDYGSYQQGDSPFCSACRATIYPPVDGVGPTWTSTGTTLFLGAVGEEFCVPKESQLSPDAGQAFFGMDLLPQLTTNASASTLAACLAMCPAAMACMVQWDSAALVCYFAALAYDTSSSPGLKFKFKVTASTLGSAASLKGNRTHGSGGRRSSGSSSSSGGVSGNDGGGSNVSSSGGGGGSSNVSSSGAGGTTTPVVKAKAVPSGFYGRAAIPAGSEAAWLQAGIALDAGSAQTFKWGTPGEWDQSRSEAECEKKCDNTVVCFGFIYDVDARACLFRGGQDGSSTSSFFVLPSMAAAAGVAQASTTTPGRQQRATQAESPQSSGPASKGLPALLANQARRAPARLAHVPPPDASHAWQGAGMAVSAALRQPKSASNRRLRTRFPFFQDIRLS